MPKQKLEQFETECPCCRATLKIDPEVRAVISYKEQEKPKHAMFAEDLKTSVSRLQEDAARREQIFQKSVSDRKNQEQVLARKFDELLKQAKSDPDAAPPPRDFDFD